MALSNIKKEPRREITESTLGIVAVVGLVFLDYKASSFLSNLTKSTANGEIFLIMITIPLLLIVVAAISVGFLYFTHFVGEEICAMMAKLNIDPRPKQRYK